MEKTQAKVPRVLLTGAGGSVGYETLRQLVAAGCDVTVYDTKSWRNVRKFWRYRGKVRIVYGDIRDRALVGRLVQSRDVVIHLAAIIPPAADRHLVLTREVNYGGTKNIVDGIAKYNPKCFLVFSSSVSVYGDRTKDYWIRTSDPLRPSEGDYYAEMKIKTEKYIEKAGINYTILRFTAIMNRPQTDPLMFHMPLATKLEIATVQDAARALVKSLQHTKTLNGHVYNLGGGETCRTTYRDFLVKMFAIYGLQYKYLRRVAFARKNFHCGYFLDSDDLEEILHFRRDSLADYYQRVDRETNKLVRFLARIFSRPIIFFLTLRSEPLMATKKHDEKQMKKFYGGEK